KHYWIGDQEVEKLLRHGEGWLAAHPEREMIARRYLKHRRSLIEEAIARLVGEDAPDPEAEEEERAREEAAVEAPIRLNDQRLAAVVAALEESGAKRVLDLGCGEGRLLRALLAERQLERLTGLDGSYRALAVAS